MDEQEANNPLALKHYSKVEIGVICVIVLLIIGGISLIYLSVRSEASEGNAVKGSDQEILHIKIKEELKKANQELGDLLNTLKNE